MSIQTAGATKARSAPVSWLFWAANVLVVASLWCFHWVWKEKDPGTAKKLSRAEEKQRRKALVREMQKRA
jgi:hypothetical protein